MRAKNLIPLLLVSLVASSSALTTEGQKSCEELITTLKEEMKKLAGDEGNQNEAMAVRQYLRQVQNALAQENHRQIGQTLENYGNYEPSEKILKCVETITQSVKGEAAQKARNLISELETTLATAAEAVARAEEPEDLDKVIASLSRNRFNNDDGESYNNPAIRTLTNELSSARQFVTSWQDYLQASSTGNTAQAVQSLRNLASQDKSLIPRSQIIARLAYEQGDEDEIAKVLDQVKKPEDMKEAIRKLSRLLAGSRSSGSENPGPREALQTLVKLEKTYREHLAGLPVNVEVLQSPNDSSDRANTLDTTPLRAELLRLVLPRALDLPEGVIPAGNESVDAFLARAADEAIGREDTSAVLRISGVRQSLVRSANFSDKEMEALRDHAAGLKQLEAGQYLLAVVSLQKALKSGSEFVPGSKTGQVLESIRKDHPTEFEQGMMEFLTPRSTPESDYSRMPFRHFLPPHMRSPDGDPRNQGGTTIVLPVPGKDAPKSPEPSPAPPAASPPEPAR